MPSRQHKMVATTGTSGGAIAIIGGLVMEVAVSTAILDFRLIQAFDGGIWTDVIRLSLLAHWKLR